jgi:SAM-dependent methyltransferase
MMNDTAHALQKKLAIAVNNYRMFGLWQTTKDALVYFLEQRSDSFDGKYGVQTDGSVESRDAEIGDAFARANAIRYVPTREQVMLHILRTLLEPVDPSTFTFVDLGCGKGRTLLIASQFPFAGVMGVEISPLLAGLAEDNVRRYLAHPSSSGARCRQVHVECYNAAEVALPDTDLLVYMYRPFVGPVFEAVAEHLAQFKRRTGRRVLVAFSCPDEQYMFAERSDFQKLQEYWVISSEYSWSSWEVRGGH